jgi:hypothetical protein
MPLENVANPRYKSIIHLSVASAYQYRLIKPESTTSPVLLHHAMGRGITE